MKTKYTLIPFIPVAIVVIALRIMSQYGMDGNGLLFGLNKSGINYLIIGIVLGFFLLCVVMNIIDRKTAQVYKVKRNIAAGCLAVLSGIAVVGSSFLTLINASSESTDGYLMYIVAALFSVVAAVAMIITAKIHFTGKSEISNTSVLFVFPALWGCCELIIEFFAASKASISATDMTPLFCFVFITLYLFSSSMVVSRIKGRNPVKACFIYGLPAAALSLSYGVGAVITALVENTGIASVVSAAMFVAFGLYITAFSVEMFTGTLTKAEVEIIDSLPDDEDSYENSYISSGGYDDLVISTIGSEETKMSDDDYAAATQGLSDFVMGYDETDYEESTVKDSVEPVEGIVFGFSEDDSAETPDDAKPASPKKSAKQPESTVAETSAKPEQKPKDKPAHKVEKKRFLGLEKRTDKAEKPVSEKRREKTSSPASQPSVVPENSQRTLKFDDSSAAVAPVKSAQSEKTAGSVQAEKPAAPKRPADSVQSAARTFEEKPAAAVRPTAEDEAGISSERMSEIDRLLKELESKK